MFKKSFWLAFITLASVLMLTGCMSSEEDTLEETNSIVKEVFLSELEIERNFEADEFEMYKPEAFEFSEARDSNLIFFEDKQPYILFINELEEPNSKWFYDDLKEREEADSLHLRTFETENRFAYFSAEEIEEERYEVQVGIGGIKMATQTDIDHLHEDVEEMIKMVKSIDTK